eukprot:1141334-Pelagomonas_calceolata.AAC.12
MLACNHWGPGENVFDQVGQTSSQGRVGTPSRQYGPAPHTSVASLPLGMTTLTGKTLCLCPTSTAPNCSLVRCDILLRSTLTRGSVASKQGLCFCTGPPPNIEEEHSRACAFTNSSAILVNLFTTSYL